MMDLKGLIERKKAEKEAAAKAAVAAAEAQKTAATEAAVEAATKIAEAKPLVLEVLALGEPDEETLVALEEQYAELPGLRWAVEQEVRQQKADAEQKARWAQVAAFEKEIENLPTDQLTYGLASRLVEFGALEEITLERKDEIFAYNKKVREEGSASRQTFIRNAFQKEGKVSHYYLDRKAWLGVALNRHHRTLEQSRKMLVRHDVKVKPTYSSGKPQTTALGSAYAKAEGPANPLLPKVPAVEAVDVPKTPSRKVRREQKKKLEAGTGEGGRPADEGRGGGANLTLEAQRLIDEE